MRLWVNAEIEVTLPPRYRNPPRAAPSNRRNGSRTDRLPSALWRASYGLADGNALALLLPPARHRPRQLLQLHPLRLPAIEDRLNESRRGVVRRATKLQVMRSASASPAAAVLAVVKQPLPPVRLRWHRDIVGLDVCEGERTWPPTLPLCSEVPDFWGARS